MAILENVVFAYVKIQSPVKKYQSNDTEFSVDAVVSKATAKEFGKLFPKQKAKAIDTEDFEGIFKFPAPFPDQDEQYVLKFKKAHSKDGVELDAKYRPRVFEATAAGNVDVTFDKLVANGSKGQISYREVENDFGKFYQLNSILVTDMIEYKSAGGVGSDFGVSSLKEAPKNQAPVQKQEEGVKEEAPKASKPVRPVKPADEDDATEAPF